MVIGSFFILSIIISYSVITDTHSQMEELKAEINILESELIIETKEARMDGYKVGYEGVYMDVSLVS